MESSPPALITTLKKHHYSVTSSRQIVFRALTDTGPITMAQLTNKVKSHVNRASVYRTVELFEKLGIINRLQIGWKYKLELSDLFTDHHHHATCMQCGTVASLPADPQLETGIHQLAQTANFDSKSHTLEIKGLCQACRPKN